MYFIKITHQTAAKNRLQTYVAQQLTGLEYRQVADAEVLKNHLNTLVYRANRLFPRCQPLTTFLRKRRGNDGFTIGIDGLVEFNLYEQGSVFDPSEVDTTTGAEGSQTDLFN
jgi:hypothetical protein